MISAKEKSKTGKGDGESRRDADPEAGAGTGEQVFEDRLERKRDGAGRLSGGRASPAEKGAGAKSLKMMPGECEEEKRASVAGVA